MSGFLVRSLSRLILLAGVSMLVAAAATFQVLSRPASVRIGGIILQIAAAFLIGGAAALYLSGTRRVVFANERVPMPDGAQPPLGGWLILLAVALVALPVWMLLRLQPFLLEVRRVVDLAAASTAWDHASVSAGGWVLLPIFAALAPPFLQLVTTVLFVVASVSLLVLLVTRRRHFPRHYLVWVLLLSSLCVAGLRGAAATNMVADIVERAVGSSDLQTAESTQILDFVNRYTSIINSTAATLGLTLCGYLIWLPVLFLSGRVRTTFQR